jgi:2,4-dienoyl-CoA reductase-like NADH-dependent reductase (Old Yellow Enzyme family)
MNPAEILSQPLKLANGIIIPNRFVKSAMSEALGTINHCPTNNLAILYRRWAEGGIGLSITGNVMIDRRALGEPGNVVVEDESDLETLKAWATAGRQNGGQIWMQINHPGKQAPRGLNRETVAPSAIPFGPGLERFFSTPRELTHGEIKDIIQRFGKTAFLAKKAGFTGVQIQTRRNEPHGR